MTNIDSQSFDKCFNDWIIKNNITEFSLKKIKAKPVVSSHSECCLHDIHEIEFGNAEEIKKLLGKVSMMEKQLRLHECCE